MAHAGCQLVNCGFRKLVVKHESRMKRLQAERDALSHKVTELIKEKQKRAGDSVEARRATKPIATRIIHPLSMANLPPIEQAVTKKLSRSDANKAAQALENQASPSRACSPFCHQGRFRSRMRLPEEASFGHAGSPPCILSPDGRHHGKSQ